LRKIEKDVGQIEQALNKRKKKIGKNKLRFVYDVYSRELISQEMS